jgi:general secretion pathway protein I
MRPLFKKTRIKISRTGKTPTGFTLLEVLVALSLLGLAVTVVLQLFSADLKSLSASEGYVNCTLEAQAKMRELLEDPELAEGVQNGLTRNGYRYEAVVTETEKERGENLPVRLLAVEIKVFWKEGAGEKSVSLTTLKMKEKKV